MLKAAINLTLEQRGMLLDETCEDEPYSLRLTQGKKPLGNEHAMFEESFLSHGDDSNNDKKYSPTAGASYESPSRTSGAEYANDPHEVSSF